MSKRADRQGHQCPEPHAQPVRGAKRSDGVTVGYWVLSLPCKVFGHRWETQYVDYAEANIIDGWFCKRCWKVKYAASRETGRVPEPVCTCGVRGRAGMPNIVAVQHGCYCPCEPRAAVPNPSYAREAGVSDDRLDHSLSHDDLSFLLDTVIWMSGSDDFSPSGKAGVEWARRRGRVHEILGRAPWGERARLASSNTSDDQTKGSGVDK